MPFGWSYEMIYKVDPEQAVIVAIYIVTLWGLASKLQLSAIMEVTRMQMITLIKYTNALAVL